MYYAATSPRHSRRSALRMFTFLLNFLFNPIYVKAHNHQLLSVAVLDIPGTKVNNHPLLEVAVLDIPGMKARTRIVLIDVASYLAAEVQISCELSDRCPHQQPMSRAITPSGSAKRLDTAAPKDAEIPGCRFTGRFAWSVPG